jgi:hypothetical protein
MSAMPPLFFMPKNITDIKERLLMKKLTLTVLLLVFTLSTFVAGVNAANANFKDLKGDHWAYSAIQSAITMGALSGYPDGSFKPSNNITRGEFASALSRLIKLPVPSAEEEAFTDIKTDHWAKEAVERLVRLSIIKKEDYSSGFNPSEPLTRYEMFKWMVSALTVDSPSFKQALKDTEGTLVPFVEYYKGGIKEEKIPYVAVARGVSLTKGFPDGTIGLDKKTTRAEVAVVMNTYRKVEGTDASKYVELTEMRNVGTIGTNMYEIVDDFLIGKDYDGLPTPIENIIGKEISTYRKGKLTIHRYIVVDARAKRGDDIKGVYADMFFDKSLSRFEKAYRVYVEVSHTSGVVGLENLSFQSEVPDISGSQVFGETVAKYGFLTYPSLQDGKFFIKGKERRFWVNVNISINAGTSIVADDGTMVSFKLQ